ncbi:conjugal transfer protein TraX [Paenibacillus motobuensis]|uniref:TraX family protein n=1 Tax=Paenibacillus TaxID=44249 RepID=UPI002040FAFF|nr:MULTISPECIES: TraX family protein [Paenibacillus]MCM3040441.1 conjugal transfer protein TraX [Paenibacillus lutimineralis]MCM3647545.1 conjugal transfer protein TraX [Paenibacillus motobuensis]
MLQKGLNGFQIKLLALIFMTFDHIHFAFQGVYEVPLAFHIIGRIAAPIFIFMVTEGMRFTRNREKYMLRLWIGSLIMNIGNAMMNAHFPLKSGGIIINNIFSTLFIICLFIYGFEKLVSSLQAKQYYKVLGFSLLTLLPFISSALIFAIANTGFDHLYMIYLYKFIMTAFPSILFTEGGYVLVLLGLGFYLFGRSKIKLGAFYLISSAVYFFLSVDYSSVSALLASDIQWLMVLALPFLLLYNREKGRSMKYLFYLYYPLHIYGLVLLSYFLGR